MGQVRQSRDTCRDNPSALRLQERDLFILEGLMKMRFSTTSQLARLYFGGSRWSANKRLRKLLDAGVVRTWVRNLVEENIYSLERRGVKALCDDGEAADIVTVPRGLDGNLDHLLAVNQVRIAFALGLPEIGAEISRWRSDWELPRTRRTAIPDALFTILWDSGEEQDFALELDNETRGPKKFLQKILRYEKFILYRSELEPVPDLTVLVVGRDPKWIERYRICLAEARVDLPILFTTLILIEEKGVLEPIWKRASDDEDYSLRSPPFLPYRNDGTDGETVHFVGA